MIDYIEWNWNDIDQSIVWMFSWTMSMKFNMYLGLNSISIKQFVS